MYDQPATTTKHRKPVEVAVYTIRNVLLHNKLVRRVKADPWKIVYRDITNGRGPFALRMLVYSDSSLANVVGGRSQQGQVYALTNTDPTTLHGSGPDVNIAISPLAWRSGRSTRVAASSFAAETLSLHRAVDEAVHLRRVVEHILQRSIPCHVVTDHLGALQCVRSIAPDPTEKRMLPFLYSLKETLDRGEVSTLSFVPSDRNVAGLLTRHHGRHDQLRDMMMFAHAVLPGSGTTSAKKRKAEASKKYRFLL